MGGGRGEGGGGGEKERDGEVDYSKRACLQAKMSWKYPRGYSQKNWVVVPFTYIWPKSAIIPTLFMTWPKIRNSIYDLTLTSKPCFRPAL